MSLDVENLIAEIIRVEGGFVNHPDDRGGPTKYGITQAVLAAFRGHPVTLQDVMDLTTTEAFDIYWLRYVKDPGFDLVAKFSGPVACELVDTGVNMGQGVSVRFLQRSLNVLNKKQELYKDITVDGKIGPVTLIALDAYLTFRLERTLVRCLNCLQGARYLELCEARERNESFFYGWLLQRVKL